MAFAWKEARISPKGMCIISAGYISSPSPPRMAVIDIIYKPWYNFYIALKDKGETHEQNSFQKNDAIACFFAFCSNAICLWP